MPAKSQPVLLHDLLIGTHQNSEKPALQMGSVALTYKEFENKSTGLATVLTDSGVTCGDRIAIFLPKGLEECWTIFAISLAGGVFVPVNPLLKGPQVAHIINDCEAIAVVTTKKMWASIGRYIDQSEHQPKPIFLDSDEQHHANDAPTTTAHAVLGEDLAAILYTSGSTGKPKGVMLTHANLLAGARIVSDYLNITEQDKLLSILPLSFDYGLNQLTSSVCQGATLFPLNFRFGDDIVKAINKFGITALAGVPSVWAILTQATPSLRSTRLGTLRYITNTGGPVPSETVSRLRELLPDTSVYLMYGLTEAFRSTYLDPSELDTRPTSIGKAIPECEVFVVDENGNRCKPGQAGILVHRGPTVSRGYWRRPEETAKVLRPNPLRRPDEGSDTVCYSGDLVTTDNEGFLYFVGRDDAMIKSAGYRISPSEVEEALMAGGGFSQVAVIGLPDPIIGNRVHAIAVRNVNANNDTLESPADCLKRCATILPGYMTPREIEIIDALPLSPNGKTDYKRLRADRVASTS